MKRSLAFAALLLGAVTGLVVPGAQAQAPIPNIPQPGSSTVFPINQPVTFRYTDAQGMGSITFTDLGLDQTTGFDLLRVNITQNGVSYNGSGITTPIPGASPPNNDLVTFTIVSPTGVAYFYEGKMGLGVEFQGSGTYHPVSDPTEIMTWGLLFAPGPPGPTPTTLSLNLDRGCGSFYPIGTPMVITYSASTNDTLTLLDQRSDGTFALFTNQAVVAGQTYSTSTFVGNFAGLRTLILQDTSGNQVTCTFTGG